MEHWSYSMIHKCRQAIQLENEHVRFGPAISDITNGTSGDNTKWYADNYEYASQILYCPYCGVELAALNKE